jgi:hypothetical protein
VIAPSCQDLPRQIEHRVTHPDRPRRRHAKASEEWWILRHALLRLPFARGTGSVSASHSDSVGQAEGGRAKPDFLIEQGGRRHGVEVTEAVPAAVIRLRQALDKDGWDNSFTNGEAYADGPNGPLSNMSKKEFAGVVERAKNQRIDRLWNGDEPERATAEVVEHGLRQKTTKAEGYRASRPDGLHLVIYVQTAIPGTCMDQVIGLLDPESVRAALDVFDCVYLFESPDEPLHPIRRPGGGT